MADRGLIIAISGPSGVGKGTVLGKVREVLPGCRTSVSVTTRAPREGEEEGIAYYFRTKEQFERMLGEGEIIEYDEYVGNYYGTPAKPLRAMSDEGFDVLADLTIAGSLALKKLFDNAVTIFLLPPSFDTLAQRLRGRGTEADEVIGRRLDQALQEMERAGEFDYAVVNDDIDSAVHKILSIVEAEKCRTSREQFKQTKEE